MAARKSVQKLIRKHKQHLKKLKKQKLLQGYSVDRQILSEIKEVEIRIESLQASLKQIPLEIEASLKNKRTEPKNAPQHNNG